MNDENRLSKVILGCAIEVHRSLGPGLLENVYQNCLHHELVAAGLNVEAECPMPVIYKEVKMECGYRIDLFVERKVVIEVKSVDALNDVHLAQVLTYLKLADCRLGLLINFNVAMLKDGVRRVANGMKP